MTAHLSGADELRSRLDRIAGGLGDLAVAHGQVAHQIESQAARNAPRRTGKLAFTVHATVTAKGATVTAGAGLVYAPVVHWGWRARGIKANPFLADAIKTAEKTYLQTYEQVVKTIVDSA